jgi:predicted nucleotide-binding protein
MTDSATASILAPTLPNPTKSARQVFVAYSYRLYPKADCRKVYKELAQAFHVEFIFADEKITSLYILQKIANYIRSSRFGIYDISGWNANVTLELGLAFGMNERAFIAIDPSKTDINEVPSDLEESIESSTARTQNSRGPGQAARPGIAGRTNARCGEPARAVQAASTEAHSRS